MRNGQIKNDQQSKGKGRACRALVLNKQRSATAHQTRGANLFFAAIHNFYSVRPQASQSQFNLCSVSPAWLSNKAML